MKKFLGLFLFIFCLIFVSGRTSTYAFGNSCSGTWNPTLPLDPANAVDPICLQCGQCGCTPDQVCIIDCTYPPPNSCGWKCDTSLTCGGCNAATAGQCGLSGACGGPCEICQGPVYTCIEDKVNCESSPACYAILHPLTSGTSPYDYSYSGLRFSNLEAVLAPVAKILFYASLVVGVLLIIYSGYALMTSEGNPQKVQQSQEQLTAAILGIMFILLSAAILRVIINSILVA